MRNSCRRRMDRRYNSKSIVKSSSAALITPSYSSAGDILSIDTASITGEPLPRNYPSEQYGALILTGTTVKAGEAYCVVRKTGINTEVCFENCC